MTVGCTCTHTQAHKHTRPHERLEIPHSLCGGATLAHKHTCPHKAGGSTLTVWRNHTHTPHTKGWRFHFCCVEEPHLQAQRAGGPHLLCEGATLTPEHSCPHKGLKVSHLLWDGATLTGLRYYWPHIHAYTHLCTWIRLPIPNGRFI